MMASLPTSICPAHLASYVQFLLAAGTVLLRMSENWTVVSSGNFMLPRSPAELAAIVAPEEQAFVTSLHFLMKNEFIATQSVIRRGSTYTTLLMRIYLVPYDLPGMRGRLHLREQRILAPARRQLANLLSRVSRNRNDWNGSEYASGSLSEPFLPPESDDRTIAELYSTLDSPNPIDVPIDLDDLATNGCLRGMRTSLYPYQRRSVEAMLCKELNQSAISNPLYIPLRGIDGSCMYLQPGTMELLIAEPMVVPNKGGILCEELGTGKTVMILALITSTLGLLSRPDEIPHSEQKVHTPVSVRTFPQSEDVRSTLLGAHNTPSPQMPYLREFMVHYCSVNPSPSQWQSSRPVLPDQLAIALAHNVPFYLHHQEDLSGSQTGRSRRRQTEIKPRLMFLTAATLVVVPPNLLNQWANEINKHCVDDSLRVLVLRDKMPLPRAAELAASYDIILMNHARFSAEAKRKDIAELHRWKPCKCPLVDPKIRVPICHCQDCSNVSPLLQIRWKRLVVDEGHVSSNVTGNLTDFAKILSVERRWLVTGTPTTNLMGLTFGNEEVVEHDQNLKEQQPEMDAQLQYPDPDIDDLPILAIPSMCHVWTSLDRDDLNKLGSMIGHFLQTAPFVALPKMFSTHVISPLMDPSGPRSGSIQVLKQVMKTVMIRHRADDVEKDITLPSKTHNIILLDLEKYGVMTYNVMQAGILINAITSERVGKDYMFHPQNQDALQSTIENMSQAMFWHIDEKLFNLYEINTHQEEYRRKAKDSLVISDQDCVSLNEALDWDTIAFKEHTWKALHRIPIPYIYHQVIGLPSQLYQAWSIFPITVSLLPHSDILTYLCSTDHLIHLQEMIFKHPLATLNHLKEWSETFKEAEALKLQLHTLPYTKKAKGSRATLLKEAQVKDPEKMKQVYEELLHAQENMNTFTNQESDLGTSQLRMDQHNKSHLLASSPLASTYIWKSTSSKLNYILNDVMTYAHTEKYLIFSHSVMTLAYISESLQLFQMKHLMFTSSIPLAQREQWVTTFETSETYRVFLMELRHGARGLNLISASRVIFCEPVWRPDDEIQAIKRVHRIGQLKPVTVKTLAIRSTYEDFMLSHRHTGVANTGSEKTGIAKDQTMRNFIAKPTFLPMPSEKVPPPEATSPLLKFPLLGLSSQQSNIGAGSSNNTSPSSTLKIRIPPHSKQGKFEGEVANKPRKVHFASEDV